MSNSVNTGRLGRINPGVDYGAQDDFTTSTALTAAQDGTLCTNAGASAAITLTLPAAIAGMEFAFAALSPYVITITATNPDTIGGGAAGGSYVIGYTATLVLGCYADGEWFIVSERKSSDGVKNIKEYGAVGDGVADDTAAIQLALDTKGTIYFPPGRYLFTAPLLFHHDTKVIGPSRGSTAALACSYSGSSYPLQIDGANGYGGWVYNLEIEDLYIDALNWSGSATHFMNITAAYSCSFKRFTIDSVAAAKKAVRISKINHYELDTFRMYSTVPDTTVGIDVDSTDGAVNGLVLKNCDIELCDTGIKFTGSTNRIICDIISLYTEANDLAVDWNSSNVESKLTILGGIITHKANSTGVKIRQSNCSVIGLVTCGGSGTTYGVDIDGASSYNSCHVIGGKINTVRDTNKLLTTNNTATTNGGGDLRGRDTFATAATKAVTFAYGLDTATYFVALSGNVNETFWVTNKATSGFTLNSSNATSTAVVDWMVRN
jgi:hypothetical protein